MPAAPLSAHGMLKLDGARFSMHFSEFVSLADAGLGLQSYVEGLETKHRLFAAALEVPTRLDLATLETLLQTVFTARRKLYPLIEALGAGRFAERAQALLASEASVTERIAAFCDALPYPPGEGRESRTQTRKLRGAAQDFAAELLHFAQPQTYPLMTRWVWDAASASGALRELMAVPDGAVHIDVPGAAEIFAAARGWLYERIAEQGIWRDRHWLADLVLAMAYVTYFRAMTGGVLGSDFTRSSTPDEQLRKLLGFDAAGGRSRVRKSAATIH